MSNSLSVCVLTTQMRDSEYKKTLILHLYLFARDWYVMIVSSIILSICDAILTDVFISHATCHVPGPGGVRRVSEVSGYISHETEPGRRLEEDLLSSHPRWGREPISISLCLLLHITNLIDYWQTLDTIDRPQYGECYSISVIDSRLPAAQAAHPSCRADTWRVKRLNGPFH